MNANKIIAIGFPLFYLVVVAVIFVFFDTGHARGILTFFSLAVAIVAAICLWVSYRWLQTRKPAKSWLFAFYALCLPFFVVAIAASVLIGAREYRNYAVSAHMAKVVVSNVHDELLLSDQGNPFGIRLSYTMTFPRGRDVNVYDGPHSAVVLRELLVSTTRINQNYVTPPLAGFHDRYQSGGTYTFTEELVPDFIRTQGEYDGSRYYTTLCLNSPYYEQRLAPNADRPYRFTVIFHNTRVDEMKTEKEYNLRSLYDGAVRDGMRPCPGSQN